MALAKSLKMANQYNANLNFNLDYNGYGTAEAGKRRQATGPFPGSLAALPYEMEGDTIKISDKDGKDDYVFRHDLVPGYGYGGRSYVVDDKTNPVFRAPGADKKGVWIVSDKQSTFINPPDSDLNKPVLHYQPLTEVEQMKPGIDMQQRLQVSIPEDLDHVNTEGYIVPNEEPIGAPLLAPGDETHIGDQMFPMDRAVYDILHDYLSTHKVDWTDLGTILESIANSQGSAHRLEVEAQQQPTPPSGVDPTGKKSRHRLRQDAIPTNFQKQQAKNGVSKGDIDSLQSLIKESNFKDERQRSTFFSALMKGIAQLG